MRATEHSVRLGDHALADVLRERHTHPTLQNIHKVPVALEQRLVLKQPADHRTRVHTRILAEKLVEIAVRRIRKLSLNEVHDLIKLVCDDIKSRKSRSGSHWEANIGVSCQYVLLPDDISRQGFQNEFCLDPNALLHISILSRPHHPLLG